MKQILIERIRNLTRMALTEDGKLCEYRTSVKGSEGLTGNVYIGRVKTILKGMDAAFVDIGTEKNAFLHAGDIQIDSASLDSENKERLQSVPITKLLKQGQELPVQVIKEPGGDKGPRISCYVTLPGRLCVLVPTLEMLGVSRKIENEEKRTALREMAVECRKELGIKCGIILRTAAENCTKEALKKDIEGLLKLWDGIDKKSRCLKAPSLLYSESSPVVTALRDIADENTEIIVRGKDLLDEVKDMAALFNPEADVTLAEGDVFSDHRIDTLLEKSLSRKVWLKSGGYLVIDHTEAMTVIDVNSGKFSGTKNLSDTVFKLNCEAAEEVMRQLRLRDIGGMVIVDFIDLDTEERQTKLLNRLKELAKNDRTKVVVVDITPLGLVEITRKKLNQPLMLKRTDECPYCRGSGRRNNAVTQAYEILSDIHNRYADGMCCLVKCSEAVCRVLKETGTDTNINAYMKSAFVSGGKDYIVEACAENELPGGCEKIPSFTL